MDRTKIFLECAKKLHADFGELGIIPHHGLKGGEAERLVRKFLNDHLPNRFEAGAGFIVDHQGGISRQTDVLIYDALNCPVYRTSEDSGVFPSDNVSAVIEVKSTINKEELRDAWDKTEIVKGLHKTPEPPSGKLVQFHTLGVVFAFECSTSLDALARNYEDFLHDAGEFGRHIDLIVVLDKGTINLAGRWPKKGSSWIPMLVEGPHSYGEGVHLCVSASYHAAYTLDAFFRILLGHLVFFRHRVDHPGFDWPNKPKQQLQYFTSLTLETDPERRKQKLAAYREEVNREFAEINAAENRNSEA